MGNVENQRHARAVFLHNAETEHVYHQVVVAEIRAAFAQNQFVVTGFFEFFHDVLHLRRAEELGLFNVDDTAGCRHRRHQIGLACQEGGQLQDVAYFRHRRALVGFVHVGNHRHAEFAFDGGKNLHAFIQSDTPVGVYGRAVGLVERGFEYIRDAEFFGNCGILFAGIKRGIQVFQYIQSAE